MITPLLSIRDLRVTVETKVVIHDVVVQIMPGEVVALVGENGSGKTTLANVLMGNPGYLISDDQSPKSEILFEGKDLLKMSVSERSRAGVYMGWQNPISIPGVSVFSLCKASYESHGNKISELVMFKKKLEALAEKVGLPKEYVTRNVNEGFSGGERKRLELLQLLLLSPKLAILDEIDSGLDAKGVLVMISIIKEMNNAGTSFLLITHNKKLIDDKIADKVWEMKDGRLSTSV